MKAFVLIVVIVCVIFGLGFMFIPNIAIMPYGSTLDTTGAFLARYFGASLFGLGVIYYLGRGAKTAEDFLKAGLLGGVVVGIAGLIVSIWDVIAGTHNALVWLNVLLYGFFTVGFGYFYFKK